MAQPPIDKPNLILNFLKGLTSGGVAGGVSSIQQPQEPQAPQHPPVTVDEVKGDLQQKGFKPSDENVQTYLDHNLDTTSNIEDHSGLAPDIEQPQTPPKPHNIVADAVASVPIFQVLGGLKKPLEIIGEGLKRFEAAKTNFLSSAVKGEIPTDVVQGLAGESKTKFPDAKLRNGPYPELGDLFREMGVPEPLAATLGFGSDVASDIGIGNAVEGGVKVAGEVAGKTISPIVAKATEIVTPVAEEIKKASNAGTKVMNDIAAIKLPADAVAQDLTPKITKAVESGVGAVKQTVGKAVTAVSDAIPEVVKEKFLAFRQQKLVKIVEETLQGKTLLDPLGPAMKQTFRQATGEEGLAGMDSSVLGQRMRNFLNSFEDEAQWSTHKNVMMDALKGDEGALGKLPIDVATDLKQGRKLIDGISTDVASEISNLIAKRPELAQYLQKRFGYEEGKFISPEKLVDIIHENVGSYVKRSYRLFNDKAFKPTKELFDRAIEGIMTDNPTYTRSKAIEYLNGLQKTKTLDLSPFANNATYAGIRVNTDSFVARRNIPDYLRKFMGEYDDPVYNLITTTRDLAEARAHFKILRNMDEMGLFKTAKEAGFDTKIKGGPLAFGLVEGKYTTPEIAAVLDHINNYNDVLDKLVLQMMQGLKFSKTVMNPATHFRNFMGNVPFSFLAGTDPFTHPAPYADAISMWRNVAKVGKGELPFTHPDYLKWRELVNNGVVGKELPNADRIKLLEDFLRNPYETQNLAGKIKAGAQNVTKFATDIYSFTDQMYKIAAYDLYKQKGMAPLEAVNEMYKWFPNYFEAGRLANEARNSQFGALFLNPFTTFRTESHRILLNGFRDSARTRMISGMMLGSKMAWNTAVLASMGLGMKDIFEYFGTRPEAVSEVVLNPRSKDYDLNTRFMDPFNTKGIFAPLQALSGATGVNPFDYILDFTTMSPDFGYSNLITGAFEPLLTGKGKYNETLSPLERISGFAKAAGPSSFTNHLPKILDPNTDELERYRRVARFFGIDAEARNADYILQDVKSRLLDKVRNREDLTAIVTALNAMGFDGQDLASNAIKKVKQEKLLGQNKKKPLSKEDVSMDKAIDMFNIK